jgi:hypothetical protein
MPAGMARGTQHAVGTSTETTAVPMHKGRPSSAFMRPAPTHCIQLTAVPAPNQARSGRLSVPPKRTMNENTSAAGPIATSPRTPLTSSRLAGARSRPIAPRRSTMPESRSTSVSAPAAAGGGEGEGEGGGGAAVPGARRDAVVRSPSRSERISLARW